MSVISSDFLANISSTASGYKSSLLEYADLSD